jgi:hypothetical protein
LDFGFSHSMDWLKPMKRTVNRPSSLVKIHVPSREWLGYIKRRYFRTGSETLKMKQAAGNRFLAAC